MLSIVTICGNKKSVGSALLETIEAEADKLKVESIWVESSLSASKFFERKGFKVKEEREVFTEGIPSKSVVLVKAHADNKLIRPGAICECTGLPFSVRRYIVSRNMCEE